MNRTSIGTFVAGALIVAGVGIGVVNVTHPDSQPAPGSFVPTASLDASQVEVVPPTVYVKVAPAACADAILAEAAYSDAQDAILAADDQVFQALLDDNGPALKRATASRTAAIAARNALDYDTMVADARECLAAK